MGKVAVLGASKKKERYSNMAVKLLLQNEHEVYPIHPLLDTLLGAKVYKSISDLPRGVDTVSIYVNPKILEEHIKEIIALSPNRVIFNPGTESEVAQSMLEAKGIKTIIGCTLVMLKTKQF